MFILRYKKVEDPTNTLNVGEVHRRVGKLLSNSQQNTWRNFLKTTTLE